MFSVSLLPALPQMNGPPPTSQVEPERSVTLLLRDAAPPRFRPTLASEPPVASTLLLLAVPVAPRVISPPARTFPPALTTSWLNAPLLPTSRLLLLVHSDPAPLTNTELPLAPQPTVPVVSN